MERTPDLSPNLLDDFPEDLTLSETLQKLVRELSQCVETLRETHELVSPQLAELEQRYPNALTNRQYQNDDQRSMGRASSSHPA